MPVDLPQCDRVVIFLDIDGVLLPVPRFTFGGGELSDPSILSLLKIIEFCGGSDKVSIILSSTWRNFPDQVDRLNKYIQKVVGDKIPRVAGGTPNGTPKVTMVTYYADDPSEQRLVRDRVDEIKRWIHTHMHDYPEACGGRWFAIDDMQLDVDERMKGHFLKTETEVGLTESSVVHALDLIRSLPDPETTAKNAAAAIIDPVLKDEEISILEDRCSQLVSTVEELRAELRQSQSELRQLQVKHVEWEKEKKEMSQRLENVSYRLAQYDFSKKNETLRAALAALSNYTGNERKELEGRVRSLVLLLRQKKEVEKARRAARRSKNPNAG